MRKMVYSVAMSLDGYAAGPQGEADWIVMDPEIDFRGMMTGWIREPAEPAVESEP